MIRQRIAPVAATLAIVGVVVAGVIAPAQPAGAATFPFTHNIKLVAQYGSGVSGGVNTRFFSLTQKTWVKLDVHHLTPRGTYFACIHVARTPDATRPMYGVLNLTNPDKSGYATGNTWVRGYIYGAHKYVVTIHRSNAKGPIMAYAVLP